MLLPNNIDIMLILAAFSLSTNGPCPPLSFAVCLRLYAEVHPFIHEAVFYLILSLLTVAL